MGYTFLEMAREIGHSAAMAKLHWDMMLLRKEKRNPRYTHRYAEYEEARALYVSRIRDSRQEPERRVRLPMAPPQTYDGSALRERNAVKPEKESDAHNPRRDK